MARYGPVTTQEELDEALEEWDEMYPDPDEEPTIDIFDYLGWSPKDFYEWQRTGIIPQEED